MKIRVLPDRVANQIAAGEVIERPAAVVKELVENALDAGATRVEVEFRHGGLELIRVEDNGEGMVRGDAVLALERHATSKLSDAADLDRLGSFGFRGEALPSIASVSRFTLRTRTADSAAGTEIAVNGGKVWHVRDVGHAVGTSIVVEHLFHPVPARRKFLKSEATESAHILSVVRLYALAFPGVAFSLVQEGKRVFQSPRCETLLDRVAEIYGRDLAAELMTVDTDDGVWTLRGLIGRPGRGRAGRQEMISYVNNRPVDSRAMHFAVMDGFRESLPEGRYPAAFLFLTCAPHHVDVNVHPAKREVRFREEPAVRGFIVRTILGRLREFGAAHAPVGPEAVTLPTLQRTGPLLDPAFVGSVVQEATPGRLDVPPVGALEPAGPAFAGWRWIGLAGGYALFESASGLILFDRAAGEERIAHDERMKEFRLGAIPSQRLLLPVTLELDPMGVAALGEARDFLQAHGFEIADFGRHTFRLEAVPGWVEEGDEQTLFRDVLAGVVDGRLNPQDSNLGREELAKMAGARAARRLGRAVGQDPEGQCRGLLARLFASGGPLTTPSGRATIVEVSWSEYARRFG